MDRDERERVAPGKRVGFAPGNKVGRQFKPGNSTGVKFAPGNTTGRKFAPGHGAGVPFAPGNPIGRSSRFQPGNTLGRKFEPGNTMGFKPGQSANPGGITRAHRAALKLAREDPSRAALERLTELMMSCDDPRAVIAAARAILSYASGPRGRTTATQPVQVIRWLDDRDFDEAGNPLPGVEAMFDPARPRRPDDSEDPRDCPGIAPSASPGV